MSQWTGSLVNMMYGGKQSVVPVVGMGVTELCWTDRHPYEIIAVKDERHITVRALDAKRVDNYGMSDMQEYEYTSNPNNHTVNLFKTQKGVWRQRIGRRLGDNIFAIGYAEKYYDFSF